MKTFDVQSVGIDRPTREVFGFIAEPSNLPKWTNAFKRADSKSADLATPKGNVRIELTTVTDAQSGIVDWKMTYQDGAVGWAYSRITPDGDRRSVYSFVLLPPPVPLEQLEGALSEQMKILANELKALKSLLETEREPVAAG